MRIVAISDQHGFLPKIPPCDLFLIAGDICPIRDHHLDFQEHWLDTTFKWWLNEEVVAKKKIIVFGNHDFVAEYRQEKIKSIFANYPDIAYLQDSETEFEGLKVYGSPWQLFFFDWAFNLYENELAEKWKLIPDNTDILVLHGPPYGYGDIAPRVNAAGYENTGSPSLLERIRVIKPKIVVFGHIHPGRGQWLLDNTILANVTVVNEKYQLVHEPMIFDL
jgi:Icc-related predicted phosphoesterase